MAWLSPAALRLLTSVFLDDQDRSFAYPDIMSEAIEAAEALGL